MLTQATQATPELMKALAKARREVGDLTKNADNSHFKSKYADLGAVQDAAAPALDANGLTIVVVPHGGTELFAGVTALIYHEPSGECREWFFNVPYGRADAQAFGGILTYCRRYVLTCLLDLVAEDDDGETAVGRGNGPLKPVGKLAPPAKTAKAKTEEAPAAPPPPPAPKSAKGREAKEVIRELVLVNDRDKLEALRAETEPFRGTPVWASIEAAGKAAVGRISQLEAMANEGPE